VAAWLATDCARLYLGSLADFAQPKTRLELHASSNKGMSHAEVKAGRDAGGQEGATIGRECRGVPG
jgi:hypothetical protein